MLTNDPMVESTMKAVEDKLWCKTAVGGVARYEGDAYHAVSGSYDGAVGNPWFICTIWLAQYHIARAQAVVELKPALDLLLWVADHALPSGVLAEQLHPVTGAPLSVAPLTWSHATFVAAIREYLAKRRELLGLGPQRPTRYRAL